MAEQICDTLMAYLPFVGIAAAVLLAGFFSGAETGAYRVNRVRLRLAQAEGLAGAGQLGRLVADMPGLICITLIGQNLAVYIAMAARAELWHVNPGHSELYAEIMATVTLAPIIFIFAEIVPKDVFNTEADRLMYVAVRPLWLAAVLFRSLGLVALLRGAGRLMTLVGRRLGLQSADETAADPYPARSRLQSILRDSAAEGVLTPYQSEVVEKIMKLRDVSIASAMVPAARAVTLRMDASAEEFQKIAQTSSYSRLPILDPTSGDAVGILRVHDVLRDMKPGEEFDLTTYLRLALDLPETMNVAQALFAMQRARLPMAFVRNNRGEFIGLVTLKDLIEEIVGELAAW